VACNIHLKNNVKPRQTHSTCAGGTWKKTIIGGRGTRNFEEEARSLIFMCDDLTTGGRKEDRNQLQ
jgi:hypothetical protein